MLIVSALSSRPTSGRAARRLAAIALLAMLSVGAAALGTASAGARPANRNGEIVFGRYDDPDTVLFTVNPDGSHERQVQLVPPLPLPQECPRWSPNGRRVATCGDPTGAASALINPDTGRYREVPQRYPGLSLLCEVWSPTGNRLACGGHDAIYTIRASDGGGLRAISTPGGDVEVGDFSPDGKHLVFVRKDANDDPVGLFVINVDGTGLKQITPTGTLLTEGVSGNWSPRGDEIVFSLHITSDVHSTIWVVHPDGSGLREIPLQDVACGGPNEDPNGIGCANPAWSPDGTKLVFVLAIGSDRNIYTVNADGTGLKQITHGGTDHFPDWGTHPPVR